MLWPLVVPKVGASFTGFTLMSKDVNDDFPLAEAIRKTLSLQLKSLLVLISRLVPLIVPDN